MPELNWYRMTLLHLSIVGCHVHETCSHLSSDYAYHTVWRLLFQQAAFQNPEHFQKQICSILKVLEVTLCHTHDVLVWP